MQRSKPDKFLSFAEVAEMIGLSKGTVQNGEGGTRDLPRIKLGGRVLFSLRAVELWMAAKAREAERRKAHARDVV
jgi:predicted DNA-binding transcriptional regulator AlpA